MVSGQTGVAGMGYIYYSEGAFGREWSTHIYSEGGLGEGVVHTHVIVRGRCGLEGVGYIYILHSGGIGKGRGGVHILFSRKQ